MAAFCIPAIAAVFFISSVKPVAWLVVIASGLLEAIYFYTLSRAYTAGDLSLIYPITRGSAPLFLLCWAIVFLGERPTAFGLVGIFVVIVGLYFLHPPLRMRVNSEHPRWMPTMWALMTGFLISIYSALDKVGIRYFQPFIYLWLILVVCLIALTPQWFYPNRRDALLREIGISQAANNSIKPGRETAKRLLYIFAVTMAGTISYLLVLAALRFTPVSYVTPVRASSVVITTWIGIRYLKEEGGIRRVIASFLVAGGIALIAFAG